MGDGPELIIWTATIFYIIPMAFSSSSIQRKFTEHLSLLKTGLATGIWKQRVPFYGTRFANGETNTPLAHPSLC